VTRYTGNLIPRQTGGPPGRVSGMTADPPEDRGESLRAFWLSPQGLVTLAVTGFALAIRLYLLTRLRYLTGVTEYDDGVYLGGAISLISGIVPYHGFAFVQPPGILLLMAPVGLLAKVSAVSSAMAAARLLTVGASAACVALLGFLVRHRGTFVTLVACGALAVYPDDIMAAHTLLLEPWMNLLILAGACLAFRNGRLAAPRQLLWAGILFGLAGAVKYWAAIPALVLLVVCLTADRKPGPGEAADPGSGRRTGRGTGRGPRAGSPPGKGRAGRFACGVLAGFAVPVLPFAVPWPGLFVRSTLLDQVSRAGSAVPEPLRLAHLTGLADLLNDAGKLTVSGNEGSLFARGDVTAASTWATGWLPVAFAALLAAFLGLGFAAGQFRARSGNAATPDTAATARATATPETAAEPLEWYALITLGGTLAAVLGYSAFFYHYSDFAAPWLAVAAGYAAGVLGGMFAGGPVASPAGRAPAGRAFLTRAAYRAGRPPGATRRLTATVAAAFIVLAGFQAWELSGSHAPDVQADATLIPPGACVVSDEISLTIAANRFTAGSGDCPDVLDSLATTLVAGHGVSVQGGAKALPQVAADWKAIFERAQYVWLSGTTDRRVPWTPGLKEWFARSFRPLHPPEGESSEGQVYVRRG
jgi:hypothetical protein